MSTPSLAREKIGLIAGAGEFPGAIADVLRADGHEVVGFGIRRAALPALKRRVNRLHWVEWGELQKLMTLLQREKIGQVVMAGKVKKDGLVKGKKTDRLLQELVKQSGNIQDLSLLNALVKLFQSQGVTLLSPERYLPSFLAGRGVLTRRQPSRVEWMDLRYGASVARHLAKLEVGQSVIVKEGCVVAVEGLEGTDRAIARAGVLAPTCVVVKMGRPGQPLALDPPAVGRATLAAMQKVGSVCLGVEAGTTVMIHRQKFIEQADRWGITVVGLTAGDMHGISI